MHVCGTVNISAFENEDSEGGGGIGLKKKKEIYVIKKKKRKEKTSSEDLTRWASGQYRCLVMPTNTCY